MDLEYYLFCRKRYENIITNLRVIIETYDILIEKEKNLKIESNNDRTFFIEKRENIIQLKNICDNKINKLCKHEFEDDLIDITPDVSQHITYCKICGFTK